MQDTFTIQSIDPASKIMVVVFNINGVDYVKDLPFFTDQDATLLTEQLKAFAKELRSEFTQLKAAVEAADQGAVPAPSDAVNAVVGQAVPVDDAPASGDSTPPTTGTPTDTTTPPADTAPASSGDATSTDTSTPADGTTPPAETPAPDAGTPATDSGSTDTSGNPTDGGSVPPPTDGTATAL